MAVPVITSVVPNVGSSSGGELVKISGSGFAENVLVLFGDQTGKMIVVREEDGQSMADAKTPAHAPGLVAVKVVNLDSTKNPIPGGQAVLSDAYRFRRARISIEADLTRLVRIILQTIKQQILENTNITVSVDYGGTTVDGLNVVTISRLPSLVLSGPRIEENRFFSTNESRESAVAGPSGPEVVRYGPAFTVNLGFTITAASDRTVELLNLMASVATFFNRNRWIEMLRNPVKPDLGTVQWEMAPEGEFRTRLDEGDDVRVFTCRFVIRGFDIDEGGPIDIAGRVDDTCLDVYFFDKGGLS